MRTRDHEEFAPLVNLADITEIELLIVPADSPVPVFPTTRLHVEAAVEASLGNLLPA